MVMVRINAVFKAAVQVIVKVKVMVKEYIEV